VNYRGLLTAFEDVPRGPLVALRSIISFQWFLRLIEAGWNSRTLLAPYRERVFELLECA